MTHQPIAKRQQPDNQHSTMRRQRASLLVCLFFLANLAFWLNACQTAAPTQPIKIGLVAPFSGPEAAAGEAIQRGILLAMDEINAAGGVLNRPLELVSRNMAITSDTTAVNDLIAQEDVVALFGGIFAGEMPGYLDAIHQHEIPLIGTWGAINHDIKSQYNSNYLFCISVTDAGAGQFLARYGLNVLGIHHPAIISDESNWSKANLSALEAALAEQGVEPVARAVFATGDANMTDKLIGLREAGADALFLIAGTFESTVVVRGLATMNWNVPVLSYWGASNRAFIEKTGPENARTVYVLQTSSFSGTISEKSEALLTEYHARFGTNQLSEIGEPTAVSHGYDGMHLLAQAIAQAGTTSGSAIKDALEDLQSPYDGVVKLYERPFSPTNHVALTTNDYIMTLWHINLLVPAPRPRLEN